MEKNKLIMACAAVVIAAGLGLEDAQGMNLIKNGFGKLEHKAMEACQYLRYGKNINGDGIDAEMFSDEDYGEAVQIELENAKKEEAERRAEVDVTQAKFDTAHELHDAAQKFYNYAHEALYEARKRLIFVADVGGNERKTTEIVANMAKMTAEERRGAMATMTVDERCAANIAMEIAETTLTEATICDFDNAKLGEKKALRILEDTIRTRDNAKAALDTAIERHAQALAAVHDKESRFEAVRRGAKTEDISS